METAMTIQAIFTETVQLSQLVVTAFLVAMMVLCYLLGNYHGQLEVMKEFATKETAPKKFKPTKDMPQAEMQKEKNTNTEEKGEREREDDIDTDMRKLLLEANANI